MFTPLGVRAAAVIGTSALTVVFVPSPLAAALVTMRSAAAPPRTRAVLAAPPSGTPLTVPVSVVTEVFVPVSVLRVEGKRRG
jgi:hypothetical protein